MEAMKDMSDNQFDLAIIDPPYGINVNQMNMGGRKTIEPTDKKWDNSIPEKKYFDELFRVSKDQIIWGGNYFGLPSNKCFFVWDKGETMYGRDFAECEYAWSSFNKPADMIKINPMQLERIHPTQKPVKLYEWLLMNYAKEGDKILDTHLGSGSIAIACHNLKFDLTGYEIDKEYYDSAVKRYEQHIKQLQLF
tara:strand:- start:190 stop:768 length:579 start_codon:yes stop_codon:yes gene_type:complete